MRTPTIRGGRRGRELFAALAVSSASACTVIVGNEADVVVDAVEELAPPAPIGAPCASHRECGEGRTCSELPGGFCTMPCTTSADCGQEGVCTTRGFCWRRCTTEADCGGRRWLCTQLGNSTTRICQPNCTYNQAGICGEYTCSIDGTCIIGCSLFNGMTLGCAAGATCSSGAGGRCRCTSSTDCGDGRRCIDGACVHRE